MRSRRRYLSIWRNDSHLCEWSSGVEEFILEEINRKDEENMSKRNLKKALSLLLAASMVFVMAGCGTGGAGNKDEGAQDSTDGSGEKKQDGASGNTGEDGPVAMGRYVEEEIDLSGQLSQPSSMCRLADGSLVIMDKGIGMLVSKDEGVTWTEETPDWFSTLKDDDVYISSMCMGPDGTAAVFLGENIGEGDNVDYIQKLHLFLPDGTQVPVEMEFTEEEMFFKQAAFKEDGTILASTYRGIYEVQRDGSYERILTLDYNPQWMWVKDNLLIIDNDWGEQEMPMLYDLGAGTAFEDQVLTEFMEENYRDRLFNGTDYCDVFLLPGEEGTVYVAGSKGIHRHVVGGNMMEQIVDGNLSLLSNPDYMVVDMMQLEGDVFLGLFTGNKLIRFTYDPNIPAVPEHVISLYSLRENADLRGAISRYQMNHPDMFVSYEIGMGEGDSVTREDAIKKLNTKIMAGEGPDLLVMDELPFASYVDKGMLLDLTDYLQEYSAKEQLFDNVIEALKKDGKAYVAPATIAIPQIVAAADGLEEMADLNDLAEVVEQMRAEYPGEDILGVSEESGILKRFAGTSEPKWITEEGTVDQEVIGAYLEQCKRIFDAQMDGLDEKVKETYEGRSGRLAEYYGQNIDEMEWEVYLDTMSYIGKEQHMMLGWTCAQYAYLEMVSLYRNEASKDAKVVPMQGQCSRIFKPATMLGISAASKQIDAAKEFLDAFLSAEIQRDYAGFPLNQEAFDSQFTPRADILGEDGEYTSLYTTDADGNGLGFTMYWPSEETIAAFKQELAALTTAYVPDPMLEEAVFKQGTNYMRGEQSLEQALEEIEEAVAIYMAE